jgi:hypothetical protein
VLALVVGLATRTTVATPRAALDGMRAAACCASHCPAMPRAPLVPRRCCLVDSTAGDQATVSATEAPQAPAGALALALVAPAALVPTAADATAVATTVRAGPDPYLRNRSLRL